MIRAAGRLRILALTALLAPVPGCEAAERSEEGAAGEDLQEGGGPVATGELTDAQIAALVQLINGTAAAVARAMEPKLTDPALKAYAASLGADHRRMMDAMPAYDGLGHAPPQASTLRAIFHSQSAMLAPLPAGPVFDAVFVATRMASQAMAVDSLVRWRSAADDGELRTAIAGAIPVVRSHLDAARTLVQRLNRGAAAGPADMTRIPPAAAPPRDTAAGVLRDTARTRPAARDAA